MFDIAFWLLMSLLAGVFAMRNADRAAGMILEKTEPWTTVEVLFFIFGGTIGTLVLGLISLVCLGMSLSYLLK